VNLANRVRQETTHLELEQLDGEFRAWLKERRRKDQFAQYKTQLDAIESVVTGAVRELATATDALDANRSQGEIYEECRLLEVRIVWLRRVWQFFRDKFDQRDDPLLGPLLKAADEVVWSCYHQIFVQAQVRGLSLLQGPAPLPYVESQFSPEAFPSELVPPGLKDLGLGGSFLRDHLNRLPIPVVRLPPACAGSPWLLVYIGHEIGHHVQYRLTDDLQTLQAIRERVEAAVEADGANPADVAVWGRWSVEIFADIFSVLVMGHWAVRAMAELEFAPPETMLKRRPLYPAPLVRLRLLAETADRLGLHGTETLCQAGVSQVDAADANCDLARVRCVVDVFMKTLPGLPVTLEELCGFRADEFRRGGAVDRWRRALRGLEDRSVESTLRAARVVASASLAAWCEVNRVDDARGRADDRAALASRTVDLIARSREEGTRADRTTDVDSSVFGYELAQVLLAADRRQLEV
jgi:hypothetical protein